MLVQCVLHFKIRMSNMKEYLNRNRIRNLNLICSWIIEQINLPYTFLAFPSKLLANFEKPYRTYSVFYADEAAGKIHQCTHVQMYLYQYLRTLGKEYVIKDVHIPQFAYNKCYCYSELLQQFQCLEKQLFTPSFCPFA